MWTHVDIPIRKYLILEFYDVEVMRIVLHIYLKAKESKIMGVINY